MTVKKKGRSKKAKKKVSKKSKANTPTESTSSTPAATIPVEPTPAEPTVSSIPAAAKPADHKPKHKNHKPSGESRSKTFKEDETLRKKQALADAKEAWKNAPDKSSTNKHTITGMSGAMIYIDQHDLPELPVVHLTGLRNCTIKLKSVRLVKLLLDRCPGCSVFLSECIIATGTMEVWECDETVNIHSDHVLDTLQVDVCKDVRVHLAHDPKDMGQIVQAGVQQLSVQFTNEAGSTSVHDFETGLKFLLPKHPELEKDDKLTQFISRFVDTEILTERLLRLANDFPTTAREQTEHHIKRHEAVGLAAVVKNSKHLTPEEREQLEELGRVAASETPRAGDAELDHELAKATRAESKRLKGNEAFKSGNVPQAAVFYTEALIIAPDSPAILANRALCLLRLDKPKDALVDADKCLALDPNYAKAHFRRGMALSVLGQHILAGQAFSRVLEITPKNKKAQDCFHMAQMKAARSRGELKR